MRLPRKPPNPRRCFNKLAGSPSFVALLACVVVFAGPTPASSGDVARSTVISCVVIDGSGLAQTGPVSETNASGAPYKRWVISDQGLDLDDRIELFWHRAESGRATLRVAVDGPVSKPTHLLSITDDTVVGVALTSDQNTTRPWMFAINFRLERVMASGMSSNPSAVKGQLMNLSCNFEDQASAGRPVAQAADGWRRSTTTD